MTTEKEYAFVSCRVLKSYGDALAQISAEEDLALATFVAYELSKPAAERNGLEMPQKPGKAMPAMPDRAEVRDVFDDMIQKTYSYTRNRAELRTYERAAKFLASKGL